MQPSRRVRTLLVVVLLGSLVAPSSAAAEERSITLDGDPISVKRAATLSCHDLVPTEVRCFRSGGEMEADIADVFRNARDGGAALLLVGYVVVYEDASYNGASRTLSTDYSNLGSIGWNDRISAFASFGATGNFREHSPAGGFLYAYSGSTMVSFLSGTYNDKFSQFNIN